MMRLILILTAFFPATAFAADPPPGAVHGVDLVGSLPEATRAISINFIDYGGRDVMFVSTQDGLFSYDLTADPAAPRRLDHLTKEELMLPGDQLDPVGQGFWENEDMDVDPARRLVFLSRDVLAFSSGVSGVHLVDAADPADLKLGRFVPLPHGHTTTCVEACQYLWTTGSGTRGEVYVTDVRDPENPVPFPAPVVTEDGAGFPNGVPIASHDVDVDGRGIAWVSGHSGLRGYRTSGDGATPAQPVLYGGGRLRGHAEDAMPRGMHNSMRPGSGDLVFVTQEAFDTCESAGRLIIASLRGHTDGTASDELPILGTWSPQDKEGTAGSGECSAHWFDMEGELLVQSFYEQGTRFLDVSDPANPIQIAYFRPDGGRAWAPYLRRGLVYVADNKRGVDILRLRRERPPAVPSASPSGEPLGDGACTPAAALGRRGLRAGPRGVRLHGTAACAVRVEVAVAKVRAGRCRYLGRKGGRLSRPRSCRAPVWHRARGDRRWTFTRRARLERGSYSVSVRPIGPGGRPGAPVTSRVSRSGGSRAEVLAPPSRGAAGGLRPSPAWGWLCPLP